ncbi:MAG: hypothetical protein Q7V03_21095 [Cypionkella sp.]|nr:hypothetical protein [Cypionkella sp.]
MSNLAYPFGIFVLGAAIWAGMHTGKETPEVAHKHWQTAGFIIAGLGMIASRQFFMGY